MAGEIRKVPADLQAAGVVTTTVGGIATTSTDGLVVQNATPATVGVPVQMSPRLRLLGTAWDTTASQTVSFWAEVVPATAATPTATLQIWYSLNGGAAFKVASISSAGAVSGEVALGSGGGATFAAAGAVYWLGRTMLRSNGDGTLQVTNNGQSAGVGLDVATDGILKVRTRAQTADADLAAASVRGNAVAFASLPATPVEGMICAVNNSNTVVWGATIAGGGANHVLAYYNGTVWTVIGK